MITAIRMVMLFLIATSPAFYADKLNNFNDLWKCILVEILVYIGLNLVLSLIEYLIEDHRREIRREMIYAEVMGMKKERLIREQKDSQYSYTERKAG